MTVISSSYDTSLVLLLDSNTQDKQAKRLCTFTQAAFDDLPLSQRQSKVLQTLTYLRNTYDLPLSAFNYEESRDCNVLTMHAFKQALAIRPTPTCLVPRMPTEICIDWIRALQNTLVEINEVGVQGNAFSSDQISTIQQILDSHKQRWMRHELTINQIKAALREESEILRGVGLDVLANKAYRLDNKECLYTQLPLSSEFALNAARLNDNPYGCAFENFWIQNLIDRPPAALFKTMEQVAKGLKCFVEATFINVLRDNNRYRDQFIVGLQRNIQAEQRPWFDRVPAIQEFCALSEETEAYRDLLKILECPVDNAFQVFLIAYLGQKIYQEKFPLLLQADELQSRRKHQWIRATQDNYQRINANKGGDTSKAIHLLQASNFDSGISAEHHPDWTHTHSVSGTRPATSWVVDLERPTPMVVAQLEHGIPHVTSISGTANLWLGLLSHFNADLKLNINIKEALLGIMMFLNYDGGHSLHEALWTAYQRESRVPVDDIYKPYMQLGLDLLPEGKEEVPCQQFVADYGHWISWYEGTSIGTTLVQAKDLAWQQTLDYFQKYSRYAQA